MQVSDTTVAHKQEDERHNHSASARAHIHTHARTHTHAQVMHGQPSLQPTDTPLMPRILAAMSSKSTLSTLFSCPRTGPLNCHEGGRKERALHARNGNTGGAEVQCNSQVVPRRYCQHLSGYHAGHVGLGRYGRGQGSQAPWKGGAWLPGWQSCKSPCRSCELGHGAE